MKKLTAVVVMCFMMVPFLYGEPSPESYRDEAFNSVKTANELVKQAVEMLKGNVNRQSIELAINLNLRAGQMYEKAANTFASLGTSYVNQSDIDGARSAMQGCISAIGDLKQRLQKY